MSYGTTTAENGQERGGFLPLVRFALVAQKVRDVGRNLQGRKLSRKELAFLWEKKVDGGSFSAYNRTAVDFGLLGVDESDSFTDTDRGRELRFSEPNSDEWILVAADLIRQSPACKDLLDLFGTEATDKQINLHLGAKQIVQNRIDVFVPIFRECMDIVKKADSLKQVAARPYTTAETSEPSMWVTDDEYLNKMIDKRLRDHGLIQ